MIARSRAAGAGSLAAALLAWTCSPCAAAEPVLLAEEEAALVPVSGESRFTVKGVHGQIEIGTGEAGELRFHSAAPPRARAALPVALWLQDNEFRLEPRSADRERPRAVGIRVPPGMPVVLDLEEASVRVGGLQSSLEARGRALNLDVSSLAGPLAIDVQGGTVRLQSVEGDVVVGGGGLDVAGNAFGGRVTVRLTGGRAEVGEILGAVDVNADDAEIGLRDVRGPLAVTARGGKVTASLAAQGGTFGLKGAPLDLTATRGEVSVQTDAEVRFHSTEGELRIDGYGASVKGEGHDGVLEVRTAFAEVSVGAVSGNLGIQGSGLRLRVRDSSAEALVLAVSSDVEILGAQGETYVENDAGDIRVTGGAGALQVTSRKGAVRLSNLAGPVDVLADGPVLEVGWSAASGSQPSVVTNQGGGAVVKLPRSGSCRVEARARFGRVRTELPGIALEDGGKTARGDLGKGAGPTITIEAEGDIELK